MRDDFTILIDMTDADDCYFRKATGAADLAAAVPFELPLLLQFLKDGLQPNAIRSA